MGFYPNRDFPIYDDHPTTYQVGINTTWQYTYGNPIPKIGSSSFEGTTGESEQPILFTVFNTLPAKRTLFGNPAGVHTMQPYFMADKEISCQSPACGSPLDVTLYAKWGSVKGTVLLVDGTPPPYPIGVSARSAGEVPPGAGNAFANRFEFVDLSNGEFDFNSSFLIQDNPAPFLCIPGFNYVCQGIPFDIENDWGLRVLGDGGVRGNDKLHRSNVPGTFPWSIELSAEKKQTVEVRSSTASIVQFFLTLEEVFEVIEEQMENRPWEDDSPEANDGCQQGGLGAGSPGPGASPHPVSLVTGNVFLDQTDLQFTGLLHDFVFERSYNSANAGRTGGGLGRGWSHPFEKRIEPISTFILRLWGADGAPDYFTDPDKDGGFAPYGAVNPASSISKNPDGSYTRVFRTGGYEEYAADGRLRKRADRAGHATVLNYTGNNISEIVTPEGRRVRLEHQFGLLRRIVGAEGMVAEYTYDFANGIPRLSNVRYADGTGYRFSYDTTHRLTTVSDLAGVVLDRHGYVGNKSAFSELNAGREKRSYTYLADRTLVTDAHGVVSTFQFTQKKVGKLVTKITGCGFCGSNGGTQVWDYDDEGRVTRFVDADENETLYGWNGANLTTVTDALGLTTTFGSHDGFGRPGTITRTGWGTANLSYGPEGLTGVSLPTGQATLFTYENQRLKTVRTPAGTLMTFDINDLGEVVAFTDGRSRTTQFAYDAMGRVKSIKTPDGLTTRILRTGGGRVSAVERPDGKRFHYEYDASGRISKAMDEAGQTLQYAYDPYDRLRGLVDRLGAVTEFGYDLMSNQTILTDAKARTTTFEYDDFGRIEAVIDPMVGREEYEYYASGRLKVRKDRNGVRSSHVYDPLGRLRSKTYSDGTPSLGIDYDDLARTIRLSNGADTLLLSFDAAGRLLSETSSFHGATTSYTYTGDNLLETISLDGDLLARYEYDAGLVQTIHFRGKQFDLSYDDLGRRSTLRYPNGLETTYEFEPTLGWLQALTSRKAAVTLWEIGYTHDAIGNRLTRSEPGRSESYSYDAESRILGVRRTGTETATWGFAYDAVGNRTVERVEGISRSYIHDARNRLLSSESSGDLRVSGTTSEPASVKVQGEPARMLPEDVFQADVRATGGANTFTVEATDASGNTRTNTYVVDLGDGPATYDYDASGNLTSKADSSGIWTYEWDGEGRLERVVRSGSEVALFAYDALGRRIEKNAGGVRTTYAYAGSAILRESRAGQNFVYVHGPGVDEPLAKWHEPDAATYFHADGLGSIVRHTDGDANVILTRQSDVWGRPEAGASESGYAFTGREWDPETGLYYYRARYYDPIIGRFISEDPSGFSDGVNLYAYVGNSPTGLVDPRGEMKVPKWARDAFLSLYMLTGRRKPQSAELMEQMKKQTKIEQQLKKRKPGDGPDDPGAAGFALTDLLPIPLWLVAWYESIKYLQDRINEDRDNYCRQYYPAGGGPCPTREDPGFCRVYGGCPCPP